LLNNSNGYMSLCGIKCWGGSMERRDVADYRLLVTHPEANSCSLHISIKSKGQTSEKGFALNKTIKMLILDFILDFSPA